MPLDTDADAAALIRQFDDFYGRGVVAPISPVAAIGAEIAADTIANREDQ